MHFLIFYSFPLPFMRQIFQENIFFFPLFLFLQNFVTKHALIMMNMLCQDTGRLKILDGPAMVGGHGATL